MGLHESWTILLDMSSYQQIAGSFVVFASMFFTTMYIFEVLNVSLDKKLRIQAASRVTSTINAIIVSFLSLYILLTDDKYSIIQNRITHMPSNVVLTFNIVVGYMIFDLLAMLRYKAIFEWAFIVHHLVSLLGFSNCLDKGLLSFFAVFRLISEASTPFVNIRWYCLTLNLKNSKLYMYNGIAGFIVFFSCRIATILPFWYMLFSVMSLNEWQEIRPYYKYICIGGSIPLDSLNIYWFYKIVNIVVKSAKGTPDKQSNSSKPKSS